MRIALALALALLSSGCALIERNLTRGVAHCDLRVGIEPRSYCQEWRGVVQSPGSDTTARAVCATLGTTYRTAECPDLEDIVGGCFIGRMGDLSGSYHWYYTSDEDPLDEEGVRRECGDDPYVPWFPFDRDADDFGPP
jgi:hypothetical protein